MPRRTHSPRGRAAQKYREVTREAETEPTYDELARRLVESGLCSPRVLGPIPTYTHGRDRDHNHQNPTTHHRQETP